MEQACRTSWGSNLPLSVRLWRSASAALPPSDADADAEVLLKGGKSLFLHACLLKHASPFFEAALRFRKQTDGERVARVDCTDVDPRWVSAMIERAYCGRGSDAVAYPLDEFIDAVRTCARYLMDLPEHMHLAPLPMCYHVHGRRDMILSPHSYRHGPVRDDEHAVAADGSLDAAGLAAINALVGVSIVRSMRFLWCNHYAPNDEADYMDLVIVINGLELNTGRHYISSPPTVSIHGAIEAAIVRFCAAEDADLSPP